MSRPAVLERGFAEGTHLLSLTGEVPVETLAPGDFLVAKSGRSRRIREITKGYVSTAVHISATSIDGTRPTRDLVITSDQLVLLRIVNDALISVDALARNSIFNSRPSSDQSFWTLELDEEDIVLAEGVPFAIGGNADYEHITNPNLIDKIRAILKSRAAKLGWIRVDAPPLDLHLVVDGKRIEPMASRGAYRFLVPMPATQLWIMSEATIPRDVDYNADQRLLGAGLTSVRINDGLDVDHIVALDDPRLVVGFHAFEGALRWTTGSAMLPADLWRDCQGMFFLTIKLNDVILPRYVPPAVSSDIAL